MDGIGWYRYTTFVVNVCTFAIKSLDVVQVVASDDDGSPRAVQEVSGKGSNITIHHPNLVGDKDLWRYLNLN